MSQPNTNRAPTWLVTGTSSGLGLALAQQILQQRHNLISISRHPQPDPSLKALSSLTSPSGPTLHHIQIDLSHSNPELIKSPLQTFLSAHPAIPIDILVNNAGSVRFSALETIEPTAVFETMNTNFYSPLWITQIVLPRLRAPGTAAHCGKVVLNVSSTQGLAGDPSEIAYDASKHALEGMSKVLAAEVAGFGIRVIVANLGSFRTQFSGKGVSTTPTSNTISTTDSFGDESDPYGPDHPVAKRIAMVLKYSNVPNAARGDVDKGANVLFDAVMGKDGSAVDEALKRQREWSAQRGDARGRVERLVLGSDALPKIRGVVEQFAMEVETCRGLERIVDAHE